MKETSRERSRTVPSHFAGPAEPLRDFTTTWRVLPITGLALVIGVVSAYVAVALLKLIGFFTTLFFYQRFSTDFASPAGHYLGWWVVVVPAIAGLFFSPKSGFGAQKIRSHPNA